MKTKGPRQRELDTWAGWLANLPETVISVQEAWDLWELVQAAIQEVRDEKR